MQRRKEVGPPRRGWLLQELGREYHFMLVELAREEITLVYSIYRGMRARQPESRGSTGEGTGVYI
jgi:hypothetical protein